MSPGSKLRGWVPLRPAPAELNDAHFPLFLCQVLLKRVDASPSGCFTVLSVGPHSVHDLQVCINHCVYIVQ